MTTFALSLSDNAANQAQFACQHRALIEFERSHDPADSQGLTRAQVMLDAHLIEF